MPRAKMKTNVSMIKLTPKCRGAREAAATHERRTLSNMFEGAISMYCERQGIARPTLPTMAPACATRRMVATNV